MLSSPDSLREHLSIRAKEIAARHQAGASAFETCASLTLMVDATVRAAYTSLEVSRQEHLAVLALGGYGRGELCPHSDVDIMVLRPAGESYREAGKSAETFLHILWDAGLDVGHSVRTPEEVLQLHGTTGDAWAAVLESRLVCGNGGLAEALWQDLKPGDDEPYDRWFIEHVLSNQRSLHDRHGSSVKLLEPNIKKSAGGLRDLQSAFWLYRGHRPSMFISLESGQSALRIFLYQLLAEGEIHEEELSAVEHALAFLLRVRHEMHYQRGSLHDTLEYALQLKVAEGLGYSTSPPPISEVSQEARAVEVFMRDYYLHARTIHAFGQKLVHPFRDAVEPVRSPGQASESIRDLFLLHNDSLSAVPDLQRFTRAADLFEGFVIAAEREVDLDFRLRAVIERSLDLITDEARNDPVVAAFFRRILRSGRVGATLREMNELNILGTYLPEFGRLVAFFQHNVYHYFTADEHTVIAIENAERLREAPGVLHEVYRLLWRKDVLYCAVLLHDIAKPDGVADHEITGVAVAERVLRRLGMSDVFADVAFLIRHHLLMEQVAFRRNIHDPATIRGFAAHFERPEQLDYLYLLTYADLSAVNRNVWTEWKAIMLQDLYQRTSEVLRRNLQGSEIEAFHRARRDRAADEVVAVLSTQFNRREVENHLQSIPNDSYLTLFTHEEIAHHLTAGAGAGPVSVRFVHAEGYTEITVIGHDAPFALSRFCAVLSANDANIFDANIFTRDDGIIIDRFRVADAGTRRHLEQRVCDKIAEDLEKVVRGSLDIEHLFAEHRRKWRRKPKSPVNPHILTDVAFEEGGRYTIIDVYAADSVGFLYRVTETISRLGLDIYFAKIATRVDGIIDAFYVLDRSGETLAQPERREGVRSEILATIRHMAEEELA
jgi:[protein-PII] uridylyltransferase